MGCAQLVSELRLTSAAEDLARVYPWLDQAATDGGISDGVVSRMHVALQEVVANAALHGFGPGVIGAITLRLSKLSDAVLLEVEDNGGAFDPTAAPARDRPSSLADAVPGGWGLGLIRQFCPSVAYERSGGSNHLTMRFSAPE